MNDRNQLYALLFGILMSSSLFVTDQVQAEIFKCVNQQGAVYYNDKPCPVKDTETKIKNAKASKNVTSESQTPSDFQVAKDENISNEELSNLRNQQRADFMREGAAADESVNSQ